jgi:hypothetical protein
MPDIDDLLRKYKYPIEFVEAVEDTKRLDWLILHLGGLLVYREDDGRRDGPLSYRFVNHTGGHPTLRAAIDAARGD